VGREEDLVRLRELIGQLTDRERTVLHLYYHEDLHQRAIADLLGVTESRISQIRSRALACLRARFYEPAVPGPGGRVPTGIARGGGAGTALSASRQSQC